MQNQPPYLPQETDFSCAVACLRMVLASFGVMKSEEELRELSDCSIFGTAAVELVRAARSLGFHNSRKHTLSLTDLGDFTEQGCFPIVYVVLSANSPKPDVHALVVISVAGDSITVLDPKRGTLHLQVQEFCELWEPMKNLAVVIAG
ncbi:MAG: cysteine peptidase family C39 domain-containing protein [Blastocatellia bacterium]